MLIITSLVDAESQDYVHFALEFQNDEHTLYKGQDAHYHVTLPCIRAAEPSFVPGQLVIPPNVHVKLSPAHKEYLFFSLGINV